MEQIKIDFNTFQELKKAIWDENITIAARIIENIELDNLKKTILKEAFKKYKTTGNKEFLKIYIDTKNQL